MRRRWPLLLVALVSLAACGDDDGETSGEGSSSGADATAFSWETSFEQAGTGYVLTVVGAISEDEATYDLHVEPILPDAAAGGDDFTAYLAAASVNGFAEPGDGVLTSTGEEVSVDGRTEVRVRGSDRWYRSPWAAEVAAHVLGEAAWVRVPAAGEPVILDIATALFNERYDDALRRLLDAVRDGSPIEAPTPEQAASELDEVLGPWVGLAGPAYPRGAEATIAGDATEGSAGWRDDLTVAEDGVEGRLEGRVEWQPTFADFPPVPTSSVDVGDVTAGLGG
ncbi:MAG TPA: hypothetical protein VFV42_13220 [Acidimicrobiales bacterium]|nr:hypothetical protein [Acidimicrobiales bacterium]